MICRDRIEYIEDEAAVTRDYVLQNWRADVVALAAEDGDLLERVSYDPYGIPFGTHPTDITSGTTSGVTGYRMPNGVVDGSDYSVYLALYAATDWRADWDRDGDVDAADHTAYLADHGAASGSWGRGVLSNRENILGYAGYVHEPATGAAGGGHGTMYHVRHRVMHSGLGRWVQRDPAGYQSQATLYSYADANPVRFADESGLCANSTCGASSGDSRHVETGTSVPPTSPKPTPAPYTPTYPGAVCPNPERVELRCYPITGSIRNHCYIYTKCPGQLFGTACRGGPTWSGSGGDVLAAPCGDKTPPGTAIGPEGPLRTACAPFTRSHPDYGKPNESRIDLLPLTTDPAGLISCIQETFRRMDCCSSYHLLPPPGRNSNSAPGTALRRCGVQAEPPEGVEAPGFHENVDVCIAED
ncbi:MAG: RHS repeat-associated core domain-containing protein [Phycisphaerales bacterium]